MVIFKKFLVPKNLEKKTLKILNIFWVTKGLKYSYLGAKKRRNERVNF